MGWNYHDLSERMQGAIALLGRQRWEAAYKDSEEKEYRILRLDGVAVELEREIQSALDDLTITHTQKLMAPYKGAIRSEYTPVIKVFSWRSIDNIMKKSKDPDTTQYEIGDAVINAANLTCFERVFDNPDDFLAFQAMFRNDDIRDHDNGGLVLRIELGATTREGVQAILKRSGLDMRLVEFSYGDGAETIFIPNEAFPRNARPVTVYDELEERTQVNIRLH